MCIGRRNERQREVHRTRGCIGQVRGDAGRSPREDGVGDVDEARGCGGNQIYLP